MVKEFYYAARWYAPKKDPALGAPAAVYMPSGIPSHSLAKRNRQKKKKTRESLFDSEPASAVKRLFDPQVYLSALDPERCTAQCSNLVSYPWFANATATKYDSGQQKQGEWKAATKKEVGKLWNSPAGDPKKMPGVIDAAVKFQSGLGCEALILPSPLTTNPSQDYSLELEWLDVGLAAAGKLAPSSPAYATIALSDTCISGIAPSKNDLLKSISDAVTAREPQGVYVVLEQSNERGYACASANTVGALFQLVRALKKGGIARVIVSFSGVAGLAAVCLGADVWVSGWRRSERRLRLLDMEDTTARASAAYYSHQLAAEINVSKDLVRIHSQGLLDRIVDDTTIGAPLIASIRNTGKIPVDWQGRATKTSRHHFLASVTRETDRIAQLSDDACKAYGKAWLTRAAELADELKAVPNRHDRTEITHQRHWLDAFDQALK